MTILLLAVLALSIPPVQSGVPNKQPKLATDGKNVDVVFGSGSSIWVTRSDDGGRNFSPAIKVGALPAIALGRHRGPQLVLSGKAMIVSAIYNPIASTDPHPHGLPENGSLVVWRSIDDGQTWSSPTTMNDVAGSAREGLHAMAADRDGNVAVVWLDLRAPGTQLYGTVSRDGGTTWSPNVLLYRSPEKTICQCCKPSIAAAGHGHFAVMFRNALDGARDLYELSWDTSKGHGKAKKVGSGSWQLNACPMDGGGLAAHEGHVASAWRRDQTVYLVDGKGPEQAIGHGKNVDMAMTGRGPYVVWSEVDGVRLKRPDKPEPEILSKTGDFPVVTSMSGDHIAVTWEEDGEVKFALVQ